MGVCAAHYPRHRSPPQDDTGGVAVGCGETRRGPAQIPRALPCRVGMTGGALPWRNDGWCTGALVCRWLETCEELSDLGGVVHVGFPGADDALFVDDDGGTAALRGVFDVAVCCWV